MINVGLVGFGYWGPNLARNFNANPDATLYGICELNPGRAESGFPDVPAGPHVRKRG